MSTDLQRHASLTARRVDALGRRLAEAKARPLAPTEAQRVEHFHRRQQAQFSRAIDDLWERVQRTVQGLQSARRLPEEGTLYDPRLEVIREFLYQARADAAEAEAKRLAQKKPASGFLVYHLLMHYHLLLGNTGKATQFATEASKLLDQAEKQYRKSRKW
jgi:hypothetical protein